MASAIDLALFHTMERNLYQYFVGKLGIKAEVAKGVIALWLWMESIGYHDLIRHILSHKDEVLHCIVAEGQACLDALRPNATQPTSHNDIPFTAKLLNEPISLRFFHYNQDVVVEGVCYFLHKVCNIIFDECVMQQATRDEKHPTNQMGRMAGSIRPLEEAGSRTSSLGDGPSSASMVQSTLNPQAKPWCPKLEHSSQDHRSMFLTFSRGYPLAREEILNFFTTKWGNCVEALLIEKTPPGVDPMFGRIVFNHVSLIPLILNGNPTAKFVIGGKHLRARMFIPKRN